VLIRAAAAGDAIWAIMEPIFRAGETYTLPRDLDKESAHSLDRARERGFRAMQFNFVISTSERAVRLWQGFGFEIVGRLPGAFQHPALGYVDAYVMYRVL
jgi:hypothetical protein